MQPCYRHSDKQTAILCTRCRQPICTVCMVDAPVGYQCPDCASPKNSNVVNVANQSFLSRLPVVTRSILVACVAVFAISSLTGGDIFGARSFGMFPPAVAQGEWYRLLTATFLHAGLLHIAFNMYALFLLGPGLEYYLGTKRFAIVYFVSAIGASVASYAFSDIAIVSVGASGAIFGLMTATMVIGKAIRADTRQLAILLLVNLLIGAAAQGIDWRAHLGGAAIGALVAYVMVQADAKRNKNLELAGIAVIVLVLVGLTVMRTNAIQQLILG